MFHGQKEVQAIDFFLVKTISQLSGSQKCEFWNRFVLQRAQDDPGVRHAVLALSCAHRDFVSEGSDSTEMRYLGLKEYNFAIGHHIQLLSTRRGSREDDASFVSCAIIFICIEVPPIFESGKEHDLTSFPDHEWPFGLGHWYPQTNGICPSKQSTL